MDTAIDKWNNIKRRFTSFANEAYSGKQSKAQTNEIKMDKEPILRLNGSGYASNNEENPVKQVVHSEEPGKTDEVQMFKGPIVHSEEPDKMDEVQMFKGPILRLNGSGYSSNKEENSVKQRNVSFDNKGYVNDEHRESVSPPAKKSQNAQMAWDVFEETPADNFKSKNPILEKLFPIYLKTLTSVFLFMFVLGNALISRLTFLEIIQHLRLINTPPIRIDNQTTSCSLPPTITNSTDVIYDPPLLYVRWIWAVFLVICFPYGITIIKSLRKMFFQSNESVSMYILLVNVVIETFHSFGLLTLIFVVLANIDPARSSMLIYGVGLVPCLLDILSTRKKSTAFDNDDGDDRRSCFSRYSSVFSKIVLILVFISLAILLILFYMSLSTDYPSSSIDPKFKRIYYITPISLIFISLKYWNLISDTLLPRKLHKRMSKQKAKLSFLIAMLKIGYTLLFICFLYGIQSKDCIGVLFGNADSSKSNANRCGSYNVTLSFSGDKYKPFIFACLNMVTGYLCFNFARTACQLLVQRISFSLPLVLTGPISTILVLLFSSQKLSFLRMAPREPFSLICVVDLQVFLEGYYKEDPWRIFVIGFYLSFLCVTRHVWIPKVEKLAKENKLFASTGYCGALIDQSLLLSRRRDREKSIDTTNTTEPTNKIKSSNAEKMKRLKDIPLIYACATMWHETENEMMQMMKSLFRMGLDQSTRRYMRDNLGIYKDYYEFEAHIFFDDAFVRDKRKEEYRANEYVKTFVKFLPTACKAIHGDLDLGAPKKLMTPYGGRLEWIMPGGTPLIVHLKNKRLIRHKKRWSQVMYMYYFLGKGIASEVVTEEVKKTRLKNTYLLALDGDVDFEPSAVLLLVDRMTRNPKVGAACGRIHPIGTGPMVWYQKFEYAVSHWLQKSTEHMIGCVLCSPGCFSLFRGSALSSDNVLRRYTTIASEAKHKVQYDQGEDRWLCTLLLQQGYRVEYCAASDALTYCPETFNEFFKQRRRWAPSTMANIMDLLMDWQNVRQKNDSISILYIFYQACLMGASIITPGTIFMLVVGAFHTAYEITLTNSFIINLVPVVMMMLLCFFCSEDVQLQFASLMSLLYAMLMMIVIVGLAKEIATYLLCSTTTILFGFVCGTFIISALLHPKEIFCLLHGILYFVLIPAMSILLMFYALGNLQNVSWGTRDSKAEQDAKAEEAKAIAPIKPSGKEQSVLNRLQNLFAMQRARNSGTEAEYTFSFGRICRCLCFLNEENSKTEDVLLEVLHTEQEITEPSTSTQDGDTQTKSRNEDESTNVSSNEDSKHPIEWIDDEDFINMSKDEIGDVEQQFWQDLIKQYLPPEHTDTHVNEEKLKQNLVELRNHVCMFFCLINALFVIIVFTIEFSQENSKATSIVLPWCHDTDRPRKETNAITVVFLLVFGITLFVQLVAMLFHRYETFVHILASIEINPKMMNKMDIEHFWSGFADNDNNQSDAGSISTIDTLDISSKQMNLFRRRKRKKVKTFEEKIDKRFSFVYKSIHENAVGNVKFNPLMFLLSDPEIKRKAEIRMKWIRAKDKIKSRGIFQPKLKDIVNQYSSAMSTVLPENKPNGSTESNWELAHASVHHDQSKPADMDDLDGVKPHHADSDIAHQNTADADQNGTGLKTHKAKAKYIISDALNQTSDTVEPVTVATSNEVVLISMAATQDTISVEEEEVSTAF